MGLKQRIESIEEEDYRSVWPLEEQIQAALDIIKARTWERVWPEGMGPIRYRVDRDLNLRGEKYPATDREARILGALCRYAKECEAGEHEHDGDTELFEYIRDYLAEERDIVKCIDDFTDYVGKLVTRMEPARQNRREEQLYALWREVAEE